MSAPAPAGRLRVLLLAPRHTGVAGGVNRVQPSLGLGWLAAALEAAGHAVVVEDAALGAGAAAAPAGAPAAAGTVVLGDSDEGLRRRIAAARPDLVGITVPFSSAVGEALTLARLAREAAPAARVVLGGSHVNGALLDYGHAARDGVPELGRAARDLFAPAVDYALHGEAEEALVALADALAAGAAPAAVPGLCTRSGDGLAVAARPAPVDVRRLPAPARHLMDMEAYFRLGRFHSARSTSNRVLNVMASRGCPERCAFCATPATFGARVRWRDPAAVAAEIAAARRRYGIAEVQFEDDSLTAHGGNLEALCDLMAPLELPWCTPNGVRLDYHRSRQAALFRRMRAAGCYQITFACESGVPRVLEAMGKRLRPGALAPAIDAARAAGLFVHTFWMVGFPGETRAEMERTVAVATACGADSYSFAIVTPLPGTPLYREVVRRRGWWGGAAAQPGHYRRSALAVAGFASGAELERWVEGVNEAVNRAAEARDPERARRRAALVHDPALAMSRVKQT